MAMNLIGPRTIPIEAVKVTFFARAGLDQDHVLFLADLYEHKVAVDPIIVNENMEVIDGRHRLEAMRLLGFTQCQAFIAKGMNAEDSMIEALKANMKGPLPPNTADIYHVIQVLIGMGVRLSRIVAILPIPPSLAKKYVDVAKKREQRKVIASAIDTIISEGLTVAAAAERFHVDIGLLKDALGLRRKKATPELSAIFSALEKRFRGVSQQMSASAKELHQSYSDGVIGAIELEKFIDRVTTSTRLMKRTAQRIEDRLRAVMNGGHSMIDDSGEE